MPSRARDIYFESVKDLERRVAALQQVSRQARSTAPLDAVLSEVLGQAMALVGADAGALFLADAAAGVFHVGAARWASLPPAEAALREKALRQSPVKFGEGIVGQVHQTREPVTLPDVSANALFRRDLADAARYEVRNLLAVPLSLDDAPPLGVMELFNKKPKGVFSAADMELALALAGQIALLVDLRRGRAAPPAAAPVPPPAARPEPGNPPELQEARRVARDAQAQLGETRRLLEAASGVQEQNKRRLEELTRENEKLKATLEAATPPERITRLLKSIEPFAFTLSMDQVLRNFIELAARLLNAQAVRVFLWEARAERLTLAASSSPAAMAAPVAFKKGEGLAGAAADSGEIVRVAEVAKDDRFSKIIDEAPGVLARTVLAAPLAVGGRLIGVIEGVNRKDGAAFSEEDAASLAGLAFLGAAAIDKVAEHREIVEAHRTVLGLVADVIETRTVEGLGRHERVRRMARALGRELGMTEKDLRAVEWGALLQGVGQAAQPGPAPVPRANMTPAEREALMAVPRLGAELFAGAPALAEVARVVRHIHERWDGQGYPDRLAGNDIPLAARVVAVVDAFDVLSSGLGGHRGLPPEVALKELEAGAGKLFDPTCVETFVRFHRVGGFKRTGP